MEQAGRPVTSDPHRHSLHTCSCCLQDSSWSSVGFVVLLLLFFFSFDCRAAAFNPTLYLLFLFLAHFVACSFSSLHSRPIQLVYFFSNFFIFFCYLFYPQKMTLNGARVKPRPFPLTRHWIAACVRGGVGGGGGGNATSYNELKKNSYVGDLVVKKEFRISNKKNTRFNHVVKRCHSSCVSLSVGLLLCRHENQFVAVCVDQDP